MKRIIAKILGLKKPSAYLSYEEYSRRIQFLDLYHFQQSVRRANIGRTARS